MFIDIPRLDFNPTQEKVVDFNITKGEISFDTHSEFKLAYEMPIENLCLQAPQVLNQKNSLGCNFTYEIVEESHESEHSEHQDIFTPNTDEDGEEILFNCTGKIFLCKKSGSCVANYLSSNFQLPIFQITLHEGSIHSTLIEEDVEK